MKFLARQIWTVAACGIALLLAGCETVQTASNQQPAKPAYDLTVVQSSSDRKLTPEDLALLRESVAKFLADQGLVRSGEYLVRVDFPPDQPGGEGEWVIVKLTHVPTPTYTLVAANSYAGPAYFDPFDLRYGSWAAPYYYDPFDFGWGSYYRPPPLAPNHRWDHDGKDNHPGGRNDHPPGTHAGNDPRHDGSGWRDRNGRHDGDGKHDGDRSPRTTDGTPRKDDSKRPRDYGSSSTVQVARERSGGSSYTPPARSEGRSYTPPARSESHSSTPPARSESHSYSPPARSEPSYHQDSGSHSSSSNSGIQVTSNTEKEK